eukprot:TRINITY_DN3145_c1_g1_i1.p1 TRINITY_DN3145_c1_g1~~TRINITY_DN3145_c1_g1_i1.p1  ORF type:complete len:1340 (+),score=401.02 TRINITY_DN3145_c1_g1_i1:936-4955(+)
MEEPMSSTVVIFYSPGDAWRMGTVLPFEQGATTGQVQDAENRQLYTVRVPDDIYFMKSPLPFPDEIEDLLLLSEVHWGPLICTLRYRFQDERFCTSIGRDSLLCINPARPTTSEATPHLYLQDQQNLPPHPWMQVSRALMHVNNTGNDAIICLAGDPGSGKTTAAKQMIDLLLTQLPHAAQSPSSQVTLRVSADVSQEYFTTTMSRALHLPVEAFKVIDVSPTDGHVDYTFRFQDAGQDGERIARDFQSFPNLVPPEIKSSLGAVSAVVKEARVWPSKSVSIIVEALCHARTTRNANASKAIVLHRFAMANNCLVGAEIRTFLLESNRATGPPHGERTFHIFYYLLAGASDWERERYHLPSREELSEVSFAVLGKTRSQADTSSVRSPWEQSMASLHAMGACGDWVVDMEELAASYEELIDAFDACKISHRLQDWIFKILAAILHLGQISFTTTQNGATVVAPGSQDALEHVADCLQVNSQSLESALTKHIHKVRSEPVDIRLTPMQACAARDCLMRALYEKVVDITIATLNSQIEPQEEVCGWVSVLDYVGTEDGVHNDINALSTNYANEVLQNFYNKVVYNDDVKECKEELGDDYVVTSAEYTDVYGIVKLLRANLGLFSIIDEESMQQAPSDANLLDTLQSRLGNHPKFERKQVVDSFTIAHSSGPIDYNIAGFTAANRNVVLPNDLRQCLAMSLCKYTSQVFLTPQELKERQAMESEHMKSPHGDMPADFIAINTRLQLSRATSSKTTHLAKVKHQIFSLMSLVEEAKPFFIRCVRPAKGLTSGAGPLFHGRHVMKQLAAFDVLSTLQQKQMSYSIRQPFSSLLQTLWLLANDLPEKSTDPRELVCQLCNSFNIDAEGFRPGKTMAFLSKGAYSTLIDRQKQKEKVLAEVVQASCRGVLGVRLLHKNRDSLINEMKEQLQLKNTVQQKLRWEGEKMKRETVDRHNLVQEEARARRNVDNQEAVDYIAIMTGLIEGVERVREERSQKRRVEERQKQLHLKSLLSEQRLMEERRANDRLSQRMLAQGGRLDRILTKKYEAEQNMRQKREKVANTQQRLLEFRVKEEKKRIMTEQVLIQKESRHDQFVERKKQERSMVEERKLEAEANEKKAREARLRARKAWEEAKREEFDLDQIEREVINRVEAELAESKNRENHQKRLQREEELRQQKEKLERLEKIRIAKQLHREKQEKVEKMRSEEQQKKKERDSWLAQQQQRQLREEMDKIQENEERKRFARRQADKLKVGAPEVYSQIVDPLLRSASCAKSPSRSPSRRSSSNNPPLYRLAPPSPFVMASGKAIQSPMLGPSKKQGLFDYQESIHRKSRSSYSVSPARGRP